MGNYIIQWTVFPETFVLIPVTARNGNFVRLIGPNKTALIVLVDSRIFVFSFTLATLRILTSDGNDSTFTSPVHLLCSSVS